MGDLATIEADERLKALQEQKKQMQERLRVEGNCQLASIRSEGARQEQSKSCDTMVLSPYGKSSQVQDPANTPVFNFKPEERSFSWVAPHPDGPNRDVGIAVEWLHSMSNPLER